MTWSQVQTARKPIQTARSWPEVIHSVLHCRCRKAMFPATCPAAEPHGGDICGRNCQYAGVKSKCAGDMARVKITGVREIQALEYS